MDVIFASFHIENRFALGFQITHGTLFRGAKVLSAGRRPTILPVCLCHKGHIGPYINDSLLKSLGPYTHLPRVCSRRVAFTLIRIQFIMPFPSDMSEEDVGDCDSFPWSWV